MRISPQDVRSALVSLAAVVIGSLLAQWRTHDTWSVADWAIFGICWVALSFVVLAVRGRRRRGEQPPSSPSVDG